MKKSILIQGREKIRLLFVRYIKIFWSRLPREFFYYDFTFYCLVKIVYKMNINAYSQA